MRRRLVLFFLATHVGPTLAAQATATPPVALPAADYSAQEALLSIAKQSGLGLAAASLPEGKKRLEVPPSLLPDALQAVQRTFPIQIVRWRGFLVAESAPTGILQEAIRSAAPPAEFPELWRPPDTSGALTPDYDVVRDAVRVLARHETDEAARAKLARAAYWLAAPALREIIRWSAAVEEGRALVAMVPRAPTEKDPCPRHLVITAPRLGPDDLELAVWRQFHGPKFDTHEQALREQKGVIPLMEFVRRLHERALTREHPLLAGDALAGPVTLEVVGQPLSALGKALEPMGVSLAGLPEDQLVRVTLVAPNQPKRDVLVAATRIVGLVLEQGGEAGRYALSPPQVPRQRIPLVVPLAVWASLVSTSVERDRETLALVEQLAPGIDPDPNGPAHPQRVDALVPEHRELLRGLAALHTGREVAALLPALPDARGVALLQLYESAERGCYELAGVCASELVHGLEYLRLKQQLAGVTAITVPIVAGLPGHPAAAPPKGGGEQ